MILSDYPFIDGDATIDVDVATTTISQNSSGADEPPRLLSCTSLIFLLVIFFFLFLIVPLVYLIALGTTVDCLTVAFVVKIYECRY